MANPQLEDGYFKIANEIAEALRRTNLSAYQSRILWAVFRRTYGFHKKEDWISNGQMIDDTGLHKSHVSRTIRELKERNIVTKRGNKIAFQKDYQQWRELPKGVTTHIKLPIKATELPIQVTKVTKGGGYKRIHYTKDTLRDPPNPAVKNFIDFWAQTFKEKFGRPYTVSGGKEGKLIKPLLLGHGLDRLKELANDFFKSQDAFIKASGYTTGVFYSQIHKLLTDSVSHQTQGNQTQELFKKMDEAQVETAGVDPKKFRPSSLEGIN